MKVLLAVILLITLPLNAGAQHLDRQQLVSQLKKTDTTGQQQYKYIVYLINGVVFNTNDSLKIDSALLSYPIRHFMGVDFLTSRATDWAFGNNPVIIVRFAHQQARKAKQRIWKKVKPAFRDKYVSFSQHIAANAKDPVLYIDNKSIHPTEAGEKLKALSAKRIYYIEYNDQPQPQTIYGQNAKNGLVRIWTIDQ